MFTRCDYRIADQALKWTSQGHNGGGRLMTKAYLKRAVEKEMWTRGFRYNWRNMEVAAQDGSVWRRAVCGLCFIGITMHKLTVKFTKLFLATGATTRCIFKHQTTYVAKSTQNTLQLIAHIELILLLVTVF